MEYEKIPDGIISARFDWLDRCAAVIRESFATIAAEFGLTQQNCPRHTSFIKTEKLEKDFATGYLIYCYYAGGRIVGYASLSDAGDMAYELHNLAVLPEYRHRGIGKELIRFCARKVKELGGKKIMLDIIEENTRLKNWYASHGFVHTGTKTFAHLPFTAGYMELEV